MMSMNLIPVAILKIKGADYRCIISGATKSEAISYWFNQKKWNIAKLSKIKTSKRNLIIFGYAEIEKINSTATKVLSF